MNIREEYKQTWKYLKSSWNYIFVIIILFIISGVVGFYFPVFFIDEIMAMLRELMMQVEGLHGVGLIVFIIKNNLLTSLTGIVFGFLFGIIPVVVTIVNGYVLGFVMSVSVGVGGYRILLQLLPHGIFEIPAVIISLGLGLRIGVGVLKIFILTIKEMFGGRRSKRDVEFGIKEDFIGGLKVFVLFVLPLLVVAGMIEGLLIGLLG